MQISKKNKILGTALALVAIAVIVAVVLTAPGVRPPKTEDGSAETTLSGAETPTGTDAATEAPTVPPSKELPTAGEYTMTNSIVVTGNSAMEIYSIAKKRLAEYAQTVNTLKNKLPDTNVYVMLAPTRMEFYGPNEYRTGSHSQRTGIDTAYAALQDTVKRVDAYPFLAAHTDEYIYFRTDHHWTARGAYYAYTAFCQSAGLTCAPLSDYKTEVMEDFVGSMYRYTKSEKLKQNPDSVEVFMPIVEASAQYFSSAAMTDGKSLRIVSTSIKDQSSKYMAFIQGDKPLIKMTTANKNGKKILLIKESYGNAMAPFLLENYEEVYVLDPRREDMKNTDLAAFIKKQGIGDVLFLNYMMAPSNPTYMNALKSMINR